MSIVDRVSTAEDLIEANRTTLGIHEEQINGKGGVVVAIEKLTEEVKSLKRTITMVGVGVVASAIGFSFTVLSLIH